MSGTSLILCLIGFDILITIWALIGLGKIRQDQQVELGLLKWLWQEELRKKENR